MRDLSLLIKPASSLCNYRCRYCFYHDIADIRKIKSYGIMNNETIEQIVSKSINYATNSITFAFQGGEPTLAGIDYFIYFTDTVNRLNKNKKLKIYYAIQTNGSLIDDKMAQLFKKYNFLVGLSLDGPKEIHDYYRLDTSLNGTYQTVINAREILDKYNIDYNILIVVTKTVARKIQSVYNFFKRLGVKYLQFIPCLDPLDTIPFKQKYSLTPELYEYFLKTLLKLWYNDLRNNKYISIRYFDNLTQMFKGRVPEQCGLQGVCHNQIVIESDGTTFPCDFYCVDNKITGNINTNSITEILNSPVALNFIHESRIIHKKCQQCNVYFICRGGCRRERDYRLNQLPYQTQNIYCDAYYSFFEFAIPIFKDIAMHVK